jgi:hypothetical protein
VILGPFAMRNPDIDPFRVHLESAPRYLPTEALSRGINIGRHNTV